MVGAVIVYNGRIIGEGYHIRCGQAHAEVNAIRSVKDQTLLKHSTIYVSLEPFSLWQNTPLCWPDYRKANTTYRHRLPGSIFRSGRTRHTEAAQCRKRSVVGVLEKECRDLIRRFITFNTLRRPYIILKWAESSDGFIDINRSEGHPVMLSTSLTSMLDT